MDWLAGEWRRHGLFRFPCSRQALYQNLFEIVRGHFKSPLSTRLVERLAYDHARSERIVTNHVPAYFETSLEAEERQWVRETVQAGTERIRGQGIKLQYFSTVFTTMGDSGHRCAHLFLYLTQTGEKMRVEEYRFGGQDPRTNQG
jgi:hypothetical protein